MISIIDYGLGNIKAFENLYARLNVPIRIVRNAEELKNSSKIILPGVGAFDYAMSRLNDSGFREILDDLVLIKKIPIIGICVGMQMMGKSSEEGYMPGLGWIDGEVKLFNKELIPYKTRLPHMGWNTIKKINNNKLFDNLDNESRFYFLHSYFFDCYEKSSIIAMTEYGIEYASAINKDNIFGIQFHPEKSHSNGIKLLHNFATL